MKTQLEVGTFVFAWGGASICQQGKKPGGSKVKVQTPAPGWETSDTLLVGAAL